MDNNDEGSSYLPQHDKGSYPSNPGARQQPRILSRIKNLNSLAITSIGSLFSTPTSNFGTSAAGNPGEMERTINNWDCEYDLESAHGPNVFGVNDQQGNRNYKDREIKVVDTSTPIPTRSSSPLQIGRFSDVKRILNNFARSRQPDTHGQMHTRLNTTTPVDHRLTRITQSNKRIIHYDEGRFPTALSCTVPECSNPEHLATPPLTPDSFDDHALPAASLSDNSTDIWNELYPGWAGERPGYHDEDEYPPSNSLEVQEGKRPERPTYWDTSVANPQGFCRNSSLMPQTTQTPPQDDEWYGLEYTLELSTRERHPSGTQSFSTGEHSKSRESWAALHQGRIHPFFEDEDYYQWKNWHRYLDRQDERKRHRKGLAFKARAKDLAWYYADEMVTRDVMYWQKEVYGVIARDIKERLATIAERRPDPYYPTRRHNRAWYLKRSRSVGSLRELRPVPWHQFSSRAACDEEDLAIKPENDDYSLTSKD